MDCYEKFKRKMQINGGSIRNEKIRNSKLLLDSVFDDDPSAVDGVYMWVLGLNSYEKQNTIRIRLYHKRHSAATGVTVKFHTLIDTPIIIGDLIYCSLTNEYYICTESFNIDNIHWEGKLTLCNWILKWQNQNGDILEYPCYDANATQYNSGEKFNLQVTVGTSQHIITLPYDENTIKLRSPQRFILDKDTVNPVTYIVTQNDNTSYNFGTKGLIKLTVFEHPLNRDTDRLDLGICDYTEKTNSTNNNSNNENVNVKIIYSSLRIVSGGDTQVYIGKFYDNNGNEITNIDGKWDIICDFNRELEVNESGNQISIAIDNDDYVDEEFKLIFSDKDNTNQTYIIIKIDSLL